MFVSDLDSLNPKSRRRKRAPSNYVHVWLKGLINRTLKHKKESIKLLCGAGGRGVSLQIRRPPLAGHERAKPHSRSDKSRF